MKILFVFDTFNWGGAGRQFAQLYLGLTKRDVDTKILVLEGGHYFNSMLASASNIALHERKFRVDIRPLFSITNEIRKYSPDIIHAWGWMSSLAAFPAGKLYGIPLLGSLRTATLPKKTIPKLLTKFNNQHFAGIISNSHAALHNYSVRDSKGYVVYNGFDTNRIPETGLRHNVFTVVMAARMSPEKDWETFIDSILILVNRGYTGSMKFIGLGDGIKRKQLLEKASTLIESGILSLPGFKREPMEWMLNANVGVLASKPGVYEGTSNSILEYMACSLPVICSRSGGNLETVVEGETGILVEPGDSLDMANAIEKLYSSKELRLKLGSKGRNRLLKSYSFDSSIKSTMSIYSKLIKGRKLNQ